MSIVSAVKPISRVPTGIQGFDTVVKGGLPAGRPTLLCGGPGCGKTVFAVEFLARGARELGEPGLFVSFEETPQELLANFAGMALGLDEAVEAGQVRIESVLMREAPAAESGLYSLDALLLRLERWVDAVGAKRLVLDGLDTLLAAFTDGPGLRHEIRRVLRWTKEKGVTAVVTAERGEGELTRSGLEEYILDCVVLLDHRVSEQVSKRRLRVVKYRGSGHSSDEVPFLVTARGFSVLPVSSLELQAKAPTECVPTGVAGLDDLLGGRGHYRGSAVLVSGGAGTGKSTLSVAFACHSAMAGQRALYFAFEESAPQLVRNMASVGLDMEAAIASGHLHVAPLRPSAFGLEEHLLRIVSRVREVDPAVVVLDPITSFPALGGAQDVKAMLMRVLDTLKRDQVTVLLTSLTPTRGPIEDTPMAVSSLVDTWVVLRFRRQRGVRQRLLYVHKARGLPHSDQLAEFDLTARGPAVRPLTPADGVSS